MINEDNVSSLHDIFCAFEDLLIASLRPLPNKLKLDFDIDIDIDYIMRNINLSSSDSFDEKYVDGGCCRMKQRGNSRNKFTYCGKKLKQDEEFFCKKCSEMKGTAYTLQSLKEGKITINELRIQNTQSRLSRQNPGKESKFVKKFINNSGGDIFSVDVKTVISKSYSKNPKYKIVKHKNMIFKPMGNNENKFIGFDEQDGIRYTITKKEFDNVNMELSDPIMSNKINILDLNEMDRLRFS